MVLKNRFPSLYKRPKKLSFSQLDQRLFEPPVQYKIVILARRAHAVIYNEICITYGYYAVRFMYFKLSGIFSIHLWFVIVRVKAKSPLTYCMYYVYIRKGIMRAFLMGLWVIQRQVQVFFVFGCGSANCFRCMLYTEFIIPVFCFFFWGSTCTWPYILTY